jgi:membrane associated rhomboid family serine protease
MATVPPEVCVPVDAPIIPPRLVRPAFGNYAVMLLTTGAFAVQMLLDPGAQYLSGLVLEKWSLCGLLGHMWLHLTAVHLLGNLVTLWIFGHYVCPKLGDVTYVLAYVAGGVLAGMVHLACDGRPVIGASGAIMGVLGMYVVLCFRQFSPLGPWLILAWFLATLGMGIAGGFPASYTAHVGGFLGGMALAVGLIILHRVEVDAADPELTTVLGAVLAGT